MLFVLFQKTKVVAEGLSSLVNICQAVHFHGFEEARVSGQCSCLSFFSRDGITPFLVMQVYRGCRSETPYSLPFHTSWS
jgi:hypothetical protein